jgi:diamine N-acetyltransferase
MTIITFQEVTSQNWRETLTLLVQPHQQRFIAEYSPVALVALAKAYIRPFGLVWRPYAIYADGHMIGFVELAFEPDSADNYWIYHFFIDQRYQGQGYGKSAISLFINEVKEIHPACQSIQLTVHPENTQAQHLYTNAGFRATGEEAFGEPVYCLSLERR